MNWKAFKHCYYCYLQVIEFESTALMIGQLGLRVNLIAYPVVSVKKVSLAI